MILFARVLKAIAMAFKLAFNIDSSLQWRRLHNPDYSRMWLKPYWIKLKIISITKEAGEAWHMELGKF